MPTQTANKKIRLLLALRAAGITDTRVLAAIESVPRDTFVPEELKPQAWEDTALPIGCGQTISQPLVVATMTAALEPTDRDKVLEVGTGCGYQAAVLARLVRRVYTIERHKPLLQAAESRLETLGVRNVTAICGDGMAGWPAQAPFDKIIVTAAAHGEPPPVLLEQLKVGGHLVIPVGGQGEQVLRRYTKESAEGAFAVKGLLPVRFVPLLPDVAGD
ncbi:MAG TPA: protein-L-isoaspartate O-methyltransferase [Rhodospirillaceae bacterium]|nr:protein-L-isoaspartate(D-aspartate) O-methyltransferase [Alphaproteobacteria bacterium]HBH26025.1 protein-L-isoaspartate O-methyltransferase [Rhodospirillaceae bacterium]